MFISVSRENDKWVVDLSVASVYPEFRAILDDPKLGVDVMAYVALGADKSEDNPLGDVFETEQQRLEEAAKCIFGENSNVPNIPKVVDAVAKYITLTDTPYLHARADFNEALRNAGEYLKSEGKKLDKDNIVPFTTAMEKIQKMILNMNKPKKDKDKEEVKEEVVVDEKPVRRIKAGKEVGYSARRLIKA